MRRFPHSLNPSLLTLTLAAGVALLIRTATPLHAQESDADNPAPAPAAATHFLIEESSACIAREGIFLNLSSARLTANALELNIGFRNLRSVTSPSFGVLTPLDYKLVERNTRKTVTASDISASITLVSPIAGIPPRLANAGSITFPPPDSRENLELTISGFAPIRFSLVSSSEFTPLKPSELPLVETAVTLRSSHESLNVFPLHVLRVRLDEKTVNIDVAFENSSNQSVFVRNTNLSGKDAFLIDGHFQIQAPVAVSPGLADSIGPRDARWSPGHRQTGTLTFARSGPHAMRRLLISFPTYESLVLKFNDASRTFKAEVTTTGTRSPEAVSNPLRVSGELHRELTAVLDKLSKHVVNHDSAAYVSHFVPGSPAHAQQMAFLARMPQLPMRQFQFRVANEQELKLTNGGRVEGVSVYIEYGLDFLPPGNPFRSVITCSFARNPDDGDWRIDRWTFTRQIPFWQLGFTEVSQSEHFFIFYRPGSVSEEKLARSRNQLELAYNYLARFPSVRLDDKYAAFFVDREQDFLSLTSKDPTRYHGASSTSFTIVDNRFAVLNRAMYINDFGTLNASDPQHADARQKTITHELVHLALSSDTRTFSPPWLVEGIAVYLSGQLDLHKRRSLLASPSFPALSLSALSRGKLPGSGISAREALNFEYIYAGETVAYMFRAYGEERFFKFYRAFAAITPAEIDRRVIEQAGNSRDNAAAPKIMHQVTLDLTQRHFGISLYDLNTAVKSSLAIQAR